MVVVRGFTYMLNKFSRPLEAVEYVVGITILISTIVSFYSMTSGKGPTSATAFGQLIERFEIVFFVYVVLAIAASASIPAVAFGKESPGSIHVRSVAAFTYVIGLFFLSMLLLAVSGPFHMLWIQELGFAWIASIVYFNLKVNYPDANKQ